MLEVQQACVSKSSGQITLLLNEIDAKYEDGLHNYVVLKVNIYLEKYVLSRIKKGMEKYAAISLKLIYPITK